MSVAGLAEDGASRPERSLDPSHPATLLGAPREDPPTCLGKLRHGRRILRLDRSIKLARVETRNAHRVLALAFR